MRSPGLGAASPAPFSRNRLTRRSTASLNAGRWVRTASAKVARRSASEASMSQHCSNTFSSEGEAVDKIWPPNSVPCEHIKLSNGQRPRSADLAQSDPMSLRRSQRIEQLLHRHPPSEIRVYEPCPDNAVSPDDKGSGYRQDPGIIALIIGKRSTVRGQQSLKIGPDPDGK